MFRGNMVTESIPARVYALYKIVEKHNGISRTDLMSLMEPSELSKKSDGTQATSYFGPTLVCARELNLVDSQDNAITTQIEKGKIKTIQDMKKHAIIMLNSFKDEQFYKTSNAVFNMNDNVFKMGGMSDTAMTDYLSAKTGETINNIRMNGWRFWAEFLGLGYVPSATVFIPNAYRFVKVILSESNFEKNKEYLIEDFVSVINKYGSVLTDNSENNRILNMAFSNALRQLHDNREIELLNQNDRLGYQLYYSQLFSPNSVTAVVYKGVRK